MPLRGHILYRLAETAYRRPEWASRAELASYLGTSPSSINPWIWRLTWWRAATEGPTLRFDPNRVLQFASHYRLGALDPQPPIPTNLDAPSIRDALGDVPHVFCMFTAANAWAFFEPHPDHHVYVPRAALSRARAALPSLRSRARSVGQIILYAEQIDSVPSTARADLRVTSLFQTMVDLRAHATGGAHAEFLRQLILRKAAGESGAAQR